jgi:hypothetical protein
MEAMIGALVTLNIRHSTLRLCIVNNNDIAGLLLLRRRRRLIVLGSRLVWPWLLVILGRRWLVVCHYFN